MNDVSLRFRVEQIPIRMVASIGSRMCGYFGIGVIPLQPPTAAPSEVIIPVAESIYPVSAPASHDLRVFFGYFGRWRVDRSGLRWGDSDLRCFYDVFYAKTRYTPIHSDTK